MKKLILSVLWAATTAVFATATAAELAAPLIERAKLFGNPSRSAGTLAPDGKHLSWIAPVDGVMNIWVAPAGDLGKARPITREKQRPIRQHFWAPDSRSVLFLQDKGGDENFLLYGVDVKTGKETALTPFKKTRAQMVGTSRTIKNEILVGLNNRDPRWHDVHRLDLNTGKLTEVMRGDGYAGFLADDTLALRIAMKSTAAGGTDYFRITNGKVEDKPFGTTALEDALSTRAAGFTTDGKTLYWIDSRGRNTAALLAQDMASGTTQLLAQDARADIGSVLTDPVTGEIEAYSVTYLREQWIATDADVKASLDFLKTRLKGDFAVQSRTDADDQWLVASDPVSAPPAVYLYDRKQNKLSEFYTGRPELKGAPLVAMHPVEIKSRDGLTLPSYLSLPPGSDADGNGRPDAAVPMVLFVHGGPWARDRYGFNGTHQWLANRGYAVLSVNFRGSTGFGKDFITASNLEWGKKMHDDLIDATQWAVAQRITAKDKIAIMGGSYGGYATLAGMTFTPDAFACGVDIVGPSNLETLLKTIPPYWEAIRQQFHQRMGNPGTPQGLALLKERSPLYKAGQIKKPLLIGHGANDPRVNQAESDQIVATLKAKKIPVTYVLFPDEGHGFARPENSIAFNAVAENFLGKCLGGRAEPIGTTVKASSAKVPEGASFAPGLEAALK